MPSTCIVVGVPGNFCWAVTDASGRYTIDVGGYFGGSISTTQPWDIYFIRSGYITEKQTITFPSPQIVTVNHTLRPS